MAVTNGYCNESDIRKATDDISSITDVSLIERAINASSRAIDRYCGFPRRKFWLDPTPTVHEYIVEDTESIWIDDIGSTAGLVIQTDSGDGTFSSTWLTTDYRLEPLNASASGGAYAWTRIRAVSSLRFPLHAVRTSVRVTGRHGWSEIPDEVNQASVLKSIALLKRKDAPFGVAGFGEFGTAVRITRDDPDVVALLEPLRRYGAGSV